MSSKVSTAKGEVSMDLLLSSLDDQKNIGAVKKKLTDLDKDHAAPKYVSKVVADRAGREVTYNATSGEVSKWQNFVVTNRNASTLDIANDKRELPTARGLVKKFEPRTDMENEIQMILVKSNSQSDDAIQKAEVDELQQRNIPIEEIKARQAELAKVKSLLFYQQLKQHRVNKIKSKAYHRIKKRQRQRAAETEKELALQSEDAAAVAEIEEEEATRRMKERMNLKHKNTGKWAKMALQHGKHDKNLRAAYHESVQYGNELSSKINSMPHSRHKNEDEFGSDDSVSGDSEDDDEDDEEADAFDEKHGKEKKKSVASSAARKITDLFSSNGEGEDEAEAAAATGKYRKIFEMDFMKKAAETQREKARLEAGTILKELQAMEEEEEAEEERDADQGEGEGFGGDEGESGEEDGGGGGRRQQADAAKKAAEERLRAEAKKQIDALFSAGAGGGAGGMSMAKRKAGGVSSSSITSAGVNLSAAAAAPATSAAPNGKGKSAPQQPASSSSAATPSTVQQPAKVPVGGSRILPTTSIGKSNKGKQQAAVATSAAEAAAAEALAPEAPEAAATAKKAGPKEKKPLLLSQRTQEDLVEMAFAGPDLESEFAAMKRDTIDAELGIDEKKKAIENQVKAGWGDWAGPGNTGISQKTLSKRDRLMKIQEIEADKKRSERTDVKNKSMMNVVLSDRRVKTASKYKIDEIPHPFTTREEYERSLQMPIGDEWNATNVVRNNTKPEVLLRAGRIIEPAKLPAEDRKRHAAKMEQEAGGDAPGNRTFKRSHANKKHKK